ncbi:MAG: GntR family transcriptional regulator, partial [Candidatus Dormibacteraeota bacterium]|nr:GntR family transcriptional regulator [Candidatus Dormibacteraeota bacterium]
VREALRRLEQDGLVERVDRTMRVRRHSAEEILELYEVRTILETAAVRAAADRRTEFDVARMQRLLRRMEAPDLVREGRAPLNREFHSALWRASHNGVLYDTLERLYVHSLRYLHTTLTGQERWESSLPQHREIVDAILRGDGEAAAALLGDHLREARDARLQLLEP